MQYLSFIEYTKELFEEMTESYNGSFKYVDWENWKKYNHELLKLQYREYLFTEIIDITIALQKTV